MLHLHPFLLCLALLPPLEALARTALADPMVGSAADRAERMCWDVRRFGAEAVVISRIPGASHCAREAAVIGEVVRERIGVPALEIEVPPVSDTFQASLRTRLSALIETVKEQRNMSSLPLAGRVREGVVRKCFTSE